MLIQGGELLERQNGEMEFCLIPYGIKMLLHVDLLGPGWIHLRWVLCRYALFLLLPPVSAGRQAY